MDDESALDVVTRHAMRAAVAQLQSTLDTAHYELSGLPVDAVEPRLASAWRAKTGAPPDSRQLTEWATAISRGDRVVLNPR